MKTLRALIEGKKRVSPTRDDDFETLLFKRRDIEAAGTVISPTEEHAPWLVVYEQDESSILVLLFRYYQGPPLPETDEREALYSWEGESRGYAWGPFCGGEALDEHRHLHLGEEDGGYLYYPDLAMLRAFLDGIEQVYRAAELRETE